MLLILAIACLVVAPGFLLRTATLNMVTLLQLAVLIFFACCLALPFWFFYRIFLKAPLRAWRIHRIREARLMREVMEERETNRG
jgi:hypothetical protein